MTARLACIGLTVSDLDRSEAFFCAGLGFFRDAGALDRRRLRLGAQAIELAIFNPPGRPYPPDCGAADIRFQHFAIVVRDMDAAWRLVSQQAGCTAISHGGPQLLPPGDGSVLAWKFRDPDGHPLELLHFPNRAAPPGDALCLGIDHSAIVVSDVARSIAFYTGRLGLAVTARTLNTGPAQQRLDGLAQVEVDVVALAPPGLPTPHVELLAYRRPQPSGSAAAPLCDIAATRLIFGGVRDRLQEDGAERYGTDVVVRDADGHAIVLRD